MFFCIFICSHVTLRMHLKTGLGTNVWRFVYTRELRSTNPVYTRFMGDLSAINGQRNFDFHPVYAVARQ